MNITEAYEVLKRLEQAHLQTTDPSERSLAWRLEEELEKQFGGVNVLQIIGPSWKVMEKFAKYVGKDTCPQVIEDEDRLYRVIDTAYYLYWQSGFRRVKE